MTATPKPCGCPETKREHLPGCEGKCDCPGRPNRHRASCTRLQTISADDIVPCKECGEPKPRAQYHTPSDCLRHVKQELARVQAYLRDERVPPKDIKDAPSPWAIRRSEAFCNKIGCTTFHHLRDELPLFIDELFRELDETNAFVMQLCADVDGAPAPPVIEVRRMAYNATLFVNGVGCASWDLYRIFPNDSTAAQYAHSVAKSVRYALSRAPLKQDDKSCPLIDSDYMITPEEGEYVRSADGKLHPLWGAIAEAGQACVDWSHDTGLCHICDYGMVHEQGGDPVEEHAEHCPLRRLEKR